MRKIRGFRVPQALPDLLRISLFGPSLDPTRNQADERCNQDEQPRCRLSPVCSRERKAKEECPDANVRTDYCELQFEQRRSRRSSIFLERFRFELVEAKDVLHSAF